MKLTDSYLALQGYQKDGSANAVSMKDSGEVTENFDFAKRLEIRSVTLLCIGSRQAMTLRCIRM